MPHTHHRNTPLSKQPYRRAVTPPPSDDTATQVVAHPTFDTSFDESIDMPPTKDGASTKNVLIVHANIVIYAMCYWLTNPLMPYLLKQFGASSLSFGYMQSLFNIVQLAGGLVVGVLQDRYSGSTAMTITQFGSMLVYVCLLSTTSLTGLYLSRLPTVLQQSMQVAQAYISKASSGPGRAIALGRLTLSYSAGMIVGSSGGGLLVDHIGQHGVIVLAIACTAAMMVVNYLFLDSVSLHETADDKHAKKADEGADEGYVSIAMKVRRVLAFLALLFATRSMYEPVYNVLLLDKYHVAQSQMGQLISGFAAIGFVSNVLLLPAALKCVSERTLTSLAIAGGAAAYAVLGFADFSDARYFIGTSAALTLCSSMLYTLSSSYISAHTPKAVHGRSMAMTHALRSLVGIACPVIGTWLYTQHGASAVTLGNAGLLALSVAIM